MAIEIYLGKPPADIETWIMRNVAPATRATTIITTQEDGAQEFLIENTLNQQWLVDHEYYSFSENDWIKNITAIDIGVGSQEHPLSSIGDDTFYDCPTLTSVIIGESVTSIGEVAFFGCGNVVSLKIPVSVTNIGENSFGFSNLLSATVPGWQCNIPSFYTVKNLVISDGTPSIRENAFSNCDGLLNVMIPDSVTSIGNRAFEGCSNLTSVTISNSVTSIGNDAFSNCHSLLNVMIPDSVTSIGEYAFSNCYNIAELFITSKTVEYVQSMQHYPWGLNPGTIIYCSNGTLIVSSGSSSY